MVVCVNENSVKFLSILQSTHLILYEEENFIKYAKKASAQNRAKTLKIMRFLGFITPVKLLPLLSAKQTLTAFV